MHKVAPCQFLQDKAGGVTEDTTTIRVLVPSVPNLHIGIATPARALALQCTELPR